jgi:hypothetical protein
MNVTSDLAPHRLPSYRTTARDVFLRENPTVAPEILADALGLHPRTIYMYQRKLGIRLCTYHDHGHST